jgi:hypothetical protein
MYNLL